MKPLPTLLLTFSYFFLYLVIVYALGELFVSDINVIVILLIGLIFSEIFALLLLLSVPERIADKIMKKPKAVVCKNDEPNEEIVEGEEVVVDDFFERKKDESGGEEIEKQEEGMVKPAD